MYVVLLTKGEKLHLFRILKKNIIPNHIRLFLKTTFSVALFCFSRRYGSFMSPVDLNVRIQRPWLDSFPKIRIDEMVRQSPTSQLALLL